MEPSSLYYKTAPLSTDDPAPHPLMVFLHGRGSNEDDLLELVHYLPPQLLAVSVRAPYHYRYGGYTWFDLDETFGINIEQLLDNCEAIGRCLEDVQKKYPIDPRCIFLFGFSMGAMMSLVISLLKPGLFKGIIAHSGMLPQNEMLHYLRKEAGGLFFFIAHGTHDPIVPVELGREANLRLSEFCPNVTYREYPIQHTICDESLHDIALWLKNLSKSTDNAS